MTPLHAFSSHVRDGVPPFPIIAQGDTRRRLPLLVRGTPKEKRSTLDRRTVQTLQERRL
jgi:hypothetical protein